MNDQASELRQLVRQQARLAAGQPDRHPGLVVALGGKGGVGTTTLAVNLAVALAAQGHRAVLADADLGGGDASLLCRLEHRYSVADVLAGRRTVREVLQPGPGGIQVLPGVWGAQTAVDDSPAARQRLVDGLRGLANLADVIVADAGNRIAPLVRSLWRAADLVLAVTSPELPAVMDTYAAIKTLTAEDLLVPVHLVVNQAPTEEAAEEAHDRLARTCLRFLAVPVTRAGHVAADPQAAAAGGTRVLVAASPDGPAARQMRQLAGYVASSLPAAGRRKSPSMGRRIPAESVPLARVMTALQETHPHMNPVCGKGT